MPSQSFQNGQTLGQLFEPLYTQEVEAIRCVVCVTDRTDVFLVFPIARYHMFTFFIPLLCYSMDMC